MSDIKIDYEGETIEFVEYSDEWRWNNYSNVSLKKVKSYIDRAARKDFEPFVAIQSHYSEGFRKVTVTSRADDGGYWIKDPEGRRKKASDNDLFIDSADNLALIEQAATLSKQARALQDEARKVLSGMVKLKAVATGGGKEKHGR